MRLYIFLLTLFFGKFACGQAQSEIAKLKIYRIDKTIQLLNKPVILFLTSYDSIGRTIKEVVKYSYDSSVIITVTQYLTDSLIRQQSIDTIIGTERLGTTVIRHEYKFDDKKRVTENKATRSTGEQINEVYVYNNLGKIDTAFIYNNDTIIWANHPYTRLKQLKPSLSLKRIRKYSYEGSKVIVADCSLYSYSLTCCDTTETMISDTLEIYSDKSLGMQGDVLDSAQTVLITKTHKRNGLAYYIEEAMGSKSYLTYKLNK